MTVNEQAIQYLQSHHVLTLATVDPKGVWAAALFYASQDFDLIFLSAEHTRHAQNIEVNPKVSATIQENYWGWSQIKGIQLEGIVYKLLDEQRQEAIDIYLARFPFIQTAGSKIQKAFDSVSWYRITPEKLYFIDNSKGFGHRDKVITTAR